MGYYKLSGSAAFIVKKYVFFWIKLLKNEIKHNKNLCISIDWPKKCKESVI